MNTSDIIALRHPFLSGLSEAQLHALAKTATHTHFQAHEPIFREGEVANRLYLIQTGKVLLQTRSAGHPIVISMIGSGEALGWSWLFPPFFWHFEAWAYEPVDAIVLDAAQLRNDCEEDKALGYEFMKRVAETVIHRLHATRLKLIQSVKHDLRAALPRGV